MVTRSTVNDLTSNARDWIYRALDDTDRRHGRIRRLVLRKLARGVAPTLGELADALREAPDEPVPPVLIDCVTAVLHGRPRKTGPRAPRRTIADDLAVMLVYRRALAQARDAHAADGTAATAAITRAALQQTTRECKLSRRTVERIVSPRPIPGPTRR